MDFVANCSFFILIGEFLDLWAAYSCFIDDFLLNFCSLACLISRKLFCLNVKYFVSIVHLIQQHLIIDTIEIIVIIIYDVELRAISKLI